MSRELFQELRTHLMERLDLAIELSDEEILDEIDDLILGRMREYGLSLKEKVQLRQELFHSVRKLDVLQELIEDETVTEIMVNGPDAIFVERAGKLKNISAKDLDTHDQRHGDQEKNKDKFFEVLVQPVKYFFHEGPPLKIEYRYFFTNNCLTLYSYKNYRYFYFK